MFATSDAILAIASAPGPSPRGFVRLSGGEIFQLLRDHLQGLTFERGAHQARLRLADHSLPVIALIMPGPRSYTGEDCAELQMPGNPALLARVVAELLQSAAVGGSAARHAEPGEFTARAFLNGRISLTQAEGVAATIAAQSDAELRAAHLLTSGALGSFAHQLADDLANALALVEAGIDFTDQEDVVAISPEDLQNRLIAIRTRIDDQLQRSVGAEQLQAIPWVVLMGRPNAGKSALFNALLGHERAVVSPMSGTTRDVLTEPLAIDTPHGPAEVMLVDLAGLDEDDAAINQMMQAAARQAIDRAELMLRCVPINEADADSTPGEVVVWTKSDLEAKRKPGQSVAPARVVARHDAIAVSALTGAGLGELKSLIAQRLADRAISLAADAAALKPRHDDMLRSAQANLEESIALVEPIRRERHIAYPELIAATMRAALDNLSSLAGDITPDEVLGRIFATFCVGK
jgi:tRNA modification GTPase